MAQVLKMQGLLARLKEAAKTNATEIKQWLLHRLMVALALTALALPTVPTFAQSTPTLDIDLTPFFTSLNTYLPIFIGLFAIVGGISGAMALSKYVIGAIVRAFSGGGL